jgi:ankyrin repeat protein
MNDHEGIVALLLTKGADPSVKTKHGHTALTLAVEKRCHGVVKLLENS